MRDGLPLPFLTIVFVPSEINTILPSRMQWSTVHFVITQRIFSTHIGRKIAQQTSAAAKYLRRFFGAPGIPHLSQEWYIDSVVVRRTRTEKYAQMIVEELPFT